MTENRIEVLKDILLRLHHGADADSVQDTGRWIFLQLRRSESAGIAAG